MTERKAAIIPPHLIPETVGSLPIDTVRYVNVDYVYHDKTNAAYLRSDEVLDPDTRKVTQKRGKVAIMLIMLSNGETGYVADLGLLKNGNRLEDAAGDDQPEDEDEIGFWQRQKSHEVPILAIASRDPDTKEVIINGDPQFIDGARHLVDEVTVNIREFVLAQKAKKQKSKADEDAKQVKFNEAQKHAVKENKSTPADKNNKDI